MTDTVTTEVVNPHLMTPAQQDELAGELYETNRQIFGGVDKDEFTKYVVKSTAEQTEIKLFRNSAGALVGLMAVHLFERELQGKPIIIVRAEAGLLHQYRGKNTTATFALKKTLAYKLRHPRRPFYYLGSLIHPSSYSLFTKYTPVLWPNYRYPTPKPIEALISQLGDEFGHPMIDPAQPLVRYVSWFTRETDLERAYWQNSNRPDAQFYIRTNPGYAQGHGLLTLFPLQAQHILKIVANYVRFSLKQRRNSLRAYLQQAGPTKRFFAPDIPQVLRTCDFFAGLDQATLEKIAQGTELKFLSGGRYLFHENDPGNSLYVILSGTVYVTIARDGRETIIDTRETGEVFGEIALLVNTSRTASIRAAMPTTVLEVSQQMVQQLMEEAPELEDKLWDALLVRRFNTYVSNQARFASLNHQARHAWFARGVRRHLAADQSLPLTPETDDARFVFIPHGSAEIIQGDQRIVYAAPALIEITQPVQLHVNEALHMVLLPAATA